MRTSILCYLLLLLCGCNKTVDALIERAVAPSAAKKEVVNSFVTYTIKSGEHYVSNNTFKGIETGELKFAVKFDSSAIYQTKTAVNQYDINKLYGFSDNNTDHHQYSARFGWSWNEGALRLYAYVYNAGVVTSKELGAVAIGSEVSCSIKVTAASYIFTCGANTQTLPRLSTTQLAKGYLLYPYFGGDETAPHDVTVWIKDL